MLTSARIRFFRHSLSEHAGRIPVLFLLNAFLLSACGPHRITLPQMGGSGYEDHVIDRHFWNWTRLTMGPYEVRKIRVRYFHEDSSSYAYRREDNKSLRGQQFSFSVGDGSGQTGQGGREILAECLETDWRHQVDTLDHWHFDFRKGAAYPVYAEKGRKRKVDFSCRFQARGDSTWPVLLRMESPAWEGKVKALPSGISPDTAVFTIRKARTLVAGLHPNHASECLYIESGTEAWAILDESGNRIYLERGRPAGGKLMLAAVLAALHIRRENPGLTTPYPG